MPGFSPASWCATCGVLSLCFADLLPQLLMQPQTRLGRKINEFRIVEDLDGELGLLHKNGAPAAALQVHLEFLLNGELQLAIDVARNRANYAVAVHCVPLCRK